MLVNSYMSGIIDVTGDECLLSGKMICTLYAMEYNLKAHHYLQCHVYTMQHTRICMHIRTYEDHHICHTCYGMLHIIFGKGSPLGNAHYSSPCII